MPNTVTVPFEVASKKKTVKLSKEELKFWKPTIKIMTENMSDPIK